MYIFNLLHGLKYFYTSLTRNLFVVPRAKAKKAKGESRKGRTLIVNKRACFLAGKDFLIVSHLIISYCQTTRRKDDTFVSSPTRS